jgi:hypothetical protein
MRQSTIAKPSVFDKPSLMKRASIGGTNGFQELKQMAATTSAGSGFRYKSVTTHNALAASAASGTRNQ